MNLNVSTKGPAAGAIVIEWNVNDGVAYSVHARVGGLQGSEQTAAECPAGADMEKCRAAALLLHITPTGAGMFENMILSVADTDYQGNSVNVYAARGLLAQSRKATWLYSISSSNALFYQFNIFRARNIATFSLKTDTSSLVPPAPFDGSIGTFPGDPDYYCFGDDFDGCDFAWGGLISQSQQVLVQGVVSKSVSRQQKALWKLEANYQNVRIAALATVGSKFSLFSNNRGVSQAENEVQNGRGGWGRVGVYDAQSRGVQPN
jgi:hypothetical protein